MSYVTYDEFESARTPSAVYWLIGLCVAVYFVQATLVGDANMANWLGYAAGDLQSRSLWTLVTYMFVHGGLVHLLLNMWTLWLFGPRVERSWGASTFTWYYLWCGLGGWAFHAMFQPNAGILVGASAAILGVAVAYASRWPDDEVLFFGVVPMKVKWLVVFMALINITMTVIDSGSTGGTAYAAHFGGMLAGWIYLRAPNVGSLDRFRSRIAPAPDYGDEPPRAVPKTSRPRERERETDDIVAQSKAAMARVRPASKPQPKPQAAPTPAAVPAASTALDAVLDKIAASGMESLTVAERLLLDEWSKRLRDVT
ncbi:rhomboid family intramembrane serine protease [Gemmatimonas sp.]|jgi:membrane associated rhomboid family serine protease|uniref:rhomboid family intramembrane serine protease n=2 Tax=Gemmatimonas sp. TaxID=1962908 RepID=UPI0025C5163A|nr:rhomboid family intramembrane serine protease [Gemmatimonas sp.]MCA2983559.1 rhomboid family intramembrane serine protease [Gemmatimonas sp.]MCA2994674.1 rhomboid family intramembrane serine protease [Gemmatimonas sp.]